MGLINKILGNASEVSVEKLNEKYGRLLIDGEIVELGFTLLRDVFMFTNKRLILIDVQGFTGSKAEYKSMPYKNISRFSLETAGTFDLDAELKIWISSENLPTVSKKFNKSIDIYEVQRYLATKVMG
ncbi:MAG: PH domain-containing protein [Cyclobacteriaceae bacterium]|nr:PH domain-containing protein [Cyclobacteriaceae bacterium]